MRVLLVFLIASLAACGVKNGREAQTIVAQYLDAERAGRYDEAWSLLAPTDRAVHPLEAYRADHERAGPLWLEIAKRTRFQLDDARPGPEDSVLIVPVTATRPDPKAVEGMLPGVSGDAIARSADPAALIRSQVARVLDTREIPVSAESLLYAVRLLEDGGMVVWLGLDRQFTAMTYVQRAREAQARGDLDGAEASWRKVLGVPPDPAGVVGMLANEATRWLRTREATAEVVTADPVD